MSLNIQSNYIYLHKKFIHYKGSLHFKKNVTNVTLQSDNTPTYDNY